MEEKEAKGAKNKDAMRITLQSRSKNGMVYELRGEGHRLSLSIFQRENADEPSEWRVEARTAANAENAIAIAWAPTKVDALREVARMWAAKNEGLPEFDWNAVEQVLTI